MYKFRTLPVGAQEKIGSELYSESTGMTTVLGNFLRDTRLDELPQFLNVLKGDMALVGPRPVRPEVYATLCEDIPDYDLRFTVRPGLVGYAQLFTPHGTPKRIRAHIDNRLAMRRRRLSWDLIVMGYAGAVLARNLAYRLLRLVLERVVKTHILNRYQETRRLLRVRIKRAQVFCAPPVCSDPDAPPKLREFARACYGPPGPLRDMNETHFRFWTNDKLEDENYGFRLRRELHRVRGAKRKQAYCRGTVFRCGKAPADSGYAYEYVVKHEGATPLQTYLLDKYFLEKSIA
jgi:hypothetical protein